MRDYCGLLYLLDTLEYRVTFVWQRVAQLTNLARGVRLRAIGLSHLHYDVFGLTGLFSPKLSEC